MPSGSTAKASAVCSSVPPVAHHHVGPADQQFTDLAARDHAATGLDDARASCSHVRPIGVRLGSIIGNAWRILSTCNVGLGRAVEIAGSAASEAGAAASAGASRKDLAREEHQAQRREVARADVAVARQKREDRRRRIPDREPFASMIEAMRAASLPSSWPTSTSVPAGGERHEDVEDRQIEVDGRAS